MRAREIFQEFKPEVNSHVVFVTGKLAEDGLSRMMKAINPKYFTYEIKVLDIEVAAWLNDEFIIQNLALPDETSLIIIPGKTMGSEETIQKHFNVSVVRGPNCYSELPTFFEEQGLEISVDTIPRPKIVVFNDEEMALYLSKNYEIPLIDFNKVVDKLCPDSALGKAAMEKPIKHNVKAEIIRSRLIEPDTKNGWVMINYPENERDAKWLSEISSVDAFVSKTPIDFVNCTIVETKEEAFVTVEKLMNQCVAKPS